MSSADSGSSSMSRAWDRAERRRGICRAGDRVDWLTKVAARASVSKHRLEWRRSHGRRRRQFDDVRPKLGQEPQACKAGAGVMYGQAQPLRAQSRKSPSEFPVVHDPLLLGDLDNQAPGVCGPLLGPVVPDAVTTAVIKRLRADNCGAYGPETCAPRCAAVLPTQMTPAHQRLLPRATGPDRQSQFTSDAFGARRG